MTPRFKMRHSDSTPRHLVLMCPPPVSQDVAIARVWASLLCTAAIRRLRWRLSAARGSCDSALHQYGQCSGWGPWGI